MFFDPTQDYEAKRRRRIAEQLIASGKQPDKTEIVGGHAVPVSYGSALARALSAGVGQAQASAADQYDLDAAKARQKLYSEAFGKAQGGDYESAASVMAQDPQSIEGAFKLLSAGQEAKKNEKEMQMLAIALGAAQNKIPTTSPYPATIGGPTSMLPNAGGLPLTQPVAPPNLVSPSEPLPDYAQAAPNLSAAMQDPSQIPLGDFMPPAQPLAAQPSPNAPIYVGGLPATEGAPKGYQWVQDPSGRIIPQTMPGVSTADTTKVEGKNQITKIANDMAGYFAELDKMKAAPRTDAPVTSNVANSLAASRTGQYVNKLRGTEEQGIRNRIMQSRPALISAIRQSTGMSAKAMDSNVELQFYLQQATDPMLDIGANLEALRRIVDTYGVGQFKLPEGYAPPPQPGASQPDPGGFKTISSDADYDALPSGTVFVGPDGQKRRKP